ncbi:pyocin activator PrtN family protein [Vreelandella titanicae]|uniref:pyocin activator PrtN family protein n=1 Tax=Vreelandella titanicae TaxID=664683 RepID=UPI00241DC007|nr:pyocin activator PrtN family protein [Halomonas titanicae]
MSEPMPEWGEALPDNSTVGLLHQQFGKVLIPVEEVRLAYYRNLNKETFRRVLRSFRIPLPVITLDVSEKAQSYICIYQLAAYIEHRAIEAAYAQRHVLFTTSTRDRRLHQRLIDAVPITQFRDVAEATPKTTA